MERELARRGDAEIEFDVRDTLRWDMRIDDRSIDLAVANGGVRLAGRVCSISEKLAAGEDAGRIKGVTEVTNDIVVQPAVLRHDSDIARDVQDALRRDRRVDPDKIGVAVKDGIVKLTGTVPTMAQKRASTEDAWYTAGVVDLEDGIRVVPVRWHSDAAILADVETAIALSGRIFDLMRIDVSVQQGVVYLSGYVENEIERYAAEEAARLIGGVTDVINRLRISPRPPI